MSATVVHECMSLHTTVSWCVCGDLDKDLESVWELFGGSDMCMTPGIHREELLIKGGGDVGDKESLDGVKDTRKYARHNQAFVPKAKSLYGPNLIIDPGHKYKVGGQGRDKLKSGDRSISSMRGKNSSSSGQYVRRSIKSTSSSQGLDQIGFDRSNAPRSSQLRWI